MSSLTLDQRPAERRSGGLLRRLIHGAVGSSAYTSARAIYRLVDRRERQTPFPWRHKLASWSRGFRADTAAVYDFPRDDWRDYLSDYARIHRCADINPAPEIFDHKLLFRSFLLMKGFRQAETVAVVSNGDFLLHPFADEPRYLGAAEFEEWLLRDGGSYVAKPQDGGRGTDIFLLEAADGRLVRRRGTKVTPFRADALAGVTLVERRIPQAEFWRALCPESTNTIRALTMWTPGDPEPFIGTAVQRIGTAATAPTDNWSGGGINAPIDLQTGRLGLGRMHPLKGKSARTEFTHHPDTGAQIIGVVLPYWDRVCDTVLRAARTLPINRYVGWDVVVDESGTPLIIEANKNSDVNLLQVHGGLLANARVRRFYEAVGGLR
jgi:hypothetical protein